MFRTAYLTLTLVIAGLVGLTCGAGNALADHIDPGYDLFATDPNSTFLILRIPDLPPQQVRLMGVPCPCNPPALCNTDTIVHRIGGLDINVGESGVVPIQLEGLWLMSQNPVFLPDGSMADLHVTRNDLGLPGIPVYDPLDPAAGCITIHHEDPNGGTFDSSLAVTADLIFVPVGGDPTDPAQVIFHSPSDPDQLSAKGMWSFTPPPNYPSDPGFPSGGFYAGPLTELGMLIAHGVVPALCP